MATSNTPPPDPDPRNPARSWAARFGRVILQAGIAAIPRALFTHQGTLRLLAPDVWFISYILAHKWDADLPYPSLHEMAARTGVSLRQLQNIRAGLVARSYLVVQERHDPTGRRTTNGYDFAHLFAKLEELIRAEPAPANPIQEEEPPALADESDTSFIARYGRILARDGVAAVPMALFTHQADLGLSPQHVWFISYILAHKWTAAWPYPSLRKMAARTGYSVRQIHNNKDGLVDRGYLCLEPRYHPEQGQATSIYDFSALFDALIQYLDQGSPPATSPEPPPAVEPPGRRGQRRPTSVTADAPAAAARRALPALDTGPVPLTPPTPALARIPVRPDRPARPPAEDAAVPSAGPKARNSRGPHSDYLERVITDFSRELHDEAHTRSNVTQAHRLWHRLYAATGMADAAFIEDFVQAARKRTRKAQGAQGQGQIDNKMAYFFRVLRELVDQHAALGHSPAGSAWD
jgi:hypothetical protein